ncbi:MAG: hypothetical protein ACOX6O_11830 [Christensenellales bacterium]
MQETSKKKGTRTPQRRQIFRQSAIIKSTNNLPPQGSLPPSIASWLERQDNDPQPRSGFKLFNANTTLARIRMSFLSEKEGNGNTEKTIKYYRDSWNKFYDFMLYTITGKLDNDMRTEIGQLPLYAIARENLQNEYRNYMLCIGNSEQTILSNLRALRAIMNYIKKAIQKIARHRLKTVHC